MHKLLLSFSIISFLSTQSAFAVTLKEALTSGYNNDEDLKSNRVDFLNNIEQFPRAVAEFMPRVSASSQSISEKRKKTGDLALQADTVDLNNSRYTKSITLEQSIFDGGSSVAGLKAAQSAFRASRDGYYVKEQELLLAEINTYLDCVAALEQYNISIVSVKSNKTQLVAMREKFRLGESTETEVAAAESGLAKAESDGSVAYANFETAKANFTRVFGIEAANLSMPSIPDNLPNSFEEFTKIAEDANPALSSAFHRTKSAKANEYAAKGQLLPSVSVRVDASRTKYNSQNINTSSIDNNSTSSTLSLNVPILAKGGAEYSDVRRAKYATRNAVIQLDSARKQVNAQCRSAWESFNAAKSRLDSTTQGVKSAEIAYQGTLQEELLGSKTIIDVLTFQDRLNNAKYDNVDAQKQLVLASYRIKSLIGELTAEKMNLPVEYFDPNKEFKKIKLRIIGF